MKHWFNIRLEIGSYWVSTLALSLLVACGGGGGGGGGGSVAGTDNPASQIETPLAGQVVKGPTAGATVSLYRLAVDGSRTPIARATTDATGSYSIPQLLVQGDVYLLEAVNGTYVNEITGVVEPLTAPLRAIFVAGAPGLPVTLTALSDLVVREIELSTGLSKWSPTAVTAFTKIVEGRLGLTSLVHQKYIDLSKLTRENAVGLAESDLSFSNWVGVFAGFFAERKARLSVATLSETLEAFRIGSSSGVNSNEEFNSQLMGGLMRFYESVPVLLQSITPLYARLSLPSGAKATDFAGAESSGASSEPVPNLKLRFLGYYDDDFQRGTTNTVFNSRGALIGVPPAASIFGDTSFRYLGVASVADVYGDAEVAIGRWNRGYYFDNGIQYKAETNEFVTTGKTLSLMPFDLPYAAGIPATGLPTCGRFQMGLKAQTKAFPAASKSITYRLDAASRLGVYVVNQTVMIGYDLVFADAQGNKYPVSSAGGATSPSLNNTVNQNQALKLPDTNRSFDYLRLPNGEQFDFKIMLAGAGGNKALVRVSQGAEGGMAAVFGSTGPVQDCEAIATFSKGGVTPVPTAGEYYFNDFSHQSGPKPGEYIFADYSGRRTTLTFTANGTPRPPEYANITNDSAVEMSGNDEVGIGLYLLPLTNSTSGDVASLPDIYSYRKSGVQTENPAFSVSTYRLLTRTPFIVKVGDVLVSNERRLPAATLTVRQNGYGPNTYGRCELSVDLDGVTTVLNTLYYFGRCKEHSFFPSHRIDATIEFSTGGEDNFGVVTLTKTYSSNVVGKAALMMERIR